MTSAKGPGAGFRSGAFSDAHALRQSRRAACAAARRAIGTRYGEQET